jgi:ABC-type transport system involved in multi-copper enzyme maturation permease subunit
MVWRSIKRIWAIGRLTSLEGLRQPAFFFIFIAASALIALSPSFAFFHLGEEAKMVTDLGLSTILTFSTLLALLTASSTVTDEIEGRTALTMLSKPLRREEFLLGKFVGVAYSASAAVLLLAPVLMATLRSQRFEVEQDTWLSFGILGGVAILLGLFAVLLVVRLLLGRGLALVPAFWLAYLAGSAFMFLFVGAKSAADSAWDWQILLGLFFICLHACVISAMAVALATRLTLVQTAIGTGVFFLLGHASGALVAPFRNSAQELSFTGGVLRAVLPDLDQFNFADVLARGYLDQQVVIPLDVVVTSTLYALLYGVALLAIGTALFSRRELG